MGNYINKSISAKEEIIYETKQHWISLLPRGIIAFLFLAVGISSSEDGSLFAGFFIAFLIMANPLIIYFTTELGFTNKRLIGKTGLIKTKSLDSPLNKINNASVSNGLFGKILGYGIIKVSTSSGIYAYKGVANPEEFKAGLMNQIDQHDEDRIKMQAAEMANAINTSR